MIKISRVVVVFVTFLVSLQVQAGFKGLNQSAQQLLPLPVNSQFSQQSTQAFSTQALAKELHNQNKLMQYRAGNHIMGFSPEKVYVAGMGYSLIEEFVHANKVSPVSNQASNTQALNTINQKVPLLSKVNYPELYDGISLRYESNSQGIAESFWELDAGTTADAIAIRYNTDISLEDDGSLKLVHPQGKGWFSLTAPVAWQTIDGNKMPVNVAFKQINKNTLGYQISAYNPDYKITIDPILEWNTFQGSVSLGEEYPNAIALDGFGNVYIAGSSDKMWGSPLNGHTVTAGLQDDIVVLKFDSNGALVWHTFFGGTEADIAYDLALDDSGNIYITGLSRADWGSPLNGYAEGADIVVLKLTNAGALVWHTFFGSIIEGPGLNAGSDRGYGLALDNSGNIYITGESYTDWGSPINGYAADLDIVVLKLNNNGILVWHTFAGGGDSDIGRRIALDNSGNIYITGDSDATWGSPLNGHAGGGRSDITVVKLTNNGGLVWHTFFGSADSDTGNDLALDNSGNIYITGNSATTWGAPLDGHEGNRDIAVLKLDSNGALVWNTFFGGATDSESSNGIVIDNSGNIYITGDSKGWGNPLNGFAGGTSDDIVIIKLKTSGAYQWHTLYGSVDDEFGLDIAVDNLGGIYVVAENDYGNWGDPVNPHTGYYDVSVLKLYDDVIFIDGFE